MELVVWGPFTRVDPASGKLSCLDLFIATTNLRPYIKKLASDSASLLGIASTGVKKGKLVTTTSPAFSPWRGCPGWSRGRRRIPGGTWPRRAAGIGTRS